MCLTTTSSHCSLSELPPGLCCLPCPSSRCAKKKRQGLRNFFYGRDGVLTRSSLSTQAQGAEKRHGLLIALPPSARPWLHTASGSCSSRDRPMRQLLPRYTRFSPAPPISSRMTPPSPR